MNDLPATAQLRESGGWPAAVSLITLRVPRIPSAPSTWTFARAGCGRRIGRGPLVPLLGVPTDAPVPPLRRDDRADVAIEVVMSRHEVSVFGSQVERPSLLTGPREPLSNSGRFSAAAVPVIENSSKRFEHSPPPPHRGASLMRCLGPYSDAPPAWCPTSARRRRRRRQGGPSRRGPTGARPP